MPSETRDILRYLSAKEIEQLIYVAMQSYLLFNHSSLYHLGNIQRFIEGLERSSLDISYINNEINSVKEDVKQLRGELSLFHPDKSLDIFRSDMNKLIEKIARSFNIVESYEVNVTDHIPYPSSTLFFILSEMLTNASKHNPGTVIRVKIEVNLRNHELEIKLHDNGKLALPAIDQDFKIVRVLLSYTNILTDVDPSTASGLWLIIDTVYESSGKFLVRKSAELGGNEFCIRLPIIGLWKDGVLERGASAHE
jgi:K+-sensing histidine kinase KdpD